MISTADVKNNTVFEDDDGIIYQVIAYQHHRKSQSAAVYRTTLRNLARYRAGGIQGRDQDRLACACRTRRTSTKFCQRAGSSRTT